MKLDRNSNDEGIGKYALLKLRALDDCRSGTFRELPKHLEDALKTLGRAGVIDWGDKPENEFFVMRLKDKYAGGALAQYATNAAQDDPEYASEVMALAQRSGTNHPLCKRPD